MSVNGSFKLNIRDLQAREAAQNQWMVKAPEGATIEDVINPIFWTHCTNRINALDEVRVISFDGSWYAIVLVVFADGADVRCRLLSLHELDEVTESTVAEELFKISWGGPSQLFRVIRKADNLVVQSGFLTRKEAIRWVNERPR